MSENYKNYERIIQSDALNLPYKNHTWAKIGEAKVVHPGVLNVKRIRMTKHLGYMAYHKENQTYYFTDRGEALIKFVDKNLNLNIVEAEVNNDIVVHSVVGRNPGKLLTWPVSICINSLGHIFIGDHGRQGKAASIIIYDKHLNQINVIQNEHIVTPSCMEIETIDNSNFRLYVTDYRCNNLTVWNLVFSNGGYDFQHFKTVQVFGASTVRIDKSRVVVISEVSWNWKNDENKELRNLPDDVLLPKREIRRITHGLNALIIFDKELEFIDAIQLTNHLNPRGLFIDKEGRIYTTVYKLKPQKEHDINRLKEKEINQLFEKFTTIPSDKDPQTERETIMQVFHAERFYDREFTEDMYLIVIDQNADKVLQETNLGFEYIGDFLVFEDTNMNKILFMSMRDEPALHLLEFKDNY